MNDIFRERIIRRLEALPDETAYQILDYIEFLESKYGSERRQPGALQKLAETVEDTLRAGRLPVAAVKGTMDAMDAAGRVMRGVVAAGQAAAEELAGKETDSADKKEGTDHSTGV
ncbi:MAG: DUF2281 domain-containing protein [Gemmatimonadetes bacterium]|nr:DUF2281 domain-containing protein [Gemmatimonadota bacterium]